MGANISIVPATNADVDRIERLVRAAYSMYVERIGKHPAPMEANYAAAVAAGHVVLAVASDGVDRDEGADSAGELAGVLVTIPEPDHLLIENVAVDPAWQGTGIGAKLLARAEERARQAGLTELRLYTNAKMTENHDYYPKRGYRETARVTEQGFDRVYFSRDLT